MYGNGERVMTKPDDVIAIFRNGFTRSAAVFSTFSSELGLGTETAGKCACGFGAGISKTGNLCGAVSGAILVIGLKYGKTKQGDDAATGNTRVPVGEFMREFVKWHGSVNCTELPGYNLIKPGEYEQARREQLFPTKCPELVGDAVAILERIL